MEQLLIAIKNKRIQEIPALVSSLSPEFKGRAEPLYYAVRTRDSATLRLVLELLPTDDLLTILSEVVQMQWIPGIEILINSGIRFDEVNPIHAALRYNNLEMLELFGGPNTHDSEGETPLVYAVKNMDYATIRFLVNDLGADVNRSGLFKGRTDENYILASPLYAAIINQDLAVIQYLLECGAYTDHKYILLGAVNTGSIEIVKLLLSSKAPPTSEALNLAISKTYFDIAGLLISSGVDLNSTSDEDGRTSLMILLDNPPSLEINQFFDLMIASGADILAKDNADETAISHAILSKNDYAFDVLFDRKVPVDNKDLDTAINGTPHMVEKLIGAGLDVNTISDEDEFPTISLAIGRDYSPEDYSNYLSIIKLLLDAGAKTDINSPAGFPLHIAVAKFDINVVTMLLDAGANVNIYDDAYTTPLYYLLSLYGDVNSPTEEQYKEVIDLVFLLLHRGADPNITDGDGGSVLESAASRHLTPIVELLLQAKANPNNTDIDDYTPLLASIPGQGNDESAEKIVTLLLKYGADPNMADTDGETTLFKAASYSYFRTVKVLLEDGVNPNVTDSYGITPLYASLRMITAPHVVADIEATINTVLLLLQYGADPQIAAEDGSTPITLIHSLATIYPELHQELFPRLLV